MPTTTLGKELLPRVEPQQTLRRQASCVGIGLHSGKKVDLSLKPASKDSGIRFRRSDLGNLELPATFHHLSSLRLATGPDRRLACDPIIHLLAALFSAGIDNAVVEINSDEVPSMDGSAAPFIHLIREAGTQQLLASRRYLKILRPVAINHVDRNIALYPSDDFRLTCSTAFDHPLVPYCSMSISVSEHSFVDEISPARPFRLLKDVKKRQPGSLAIGGSLESAVVIGEAEVVNTGLRFEDEFVRHEMLDAIGMLALVGYPIIGHFKAHRAGQGIHSELIAKILDETDAWCLVDAAGNRPRQTIVEHIRKVELVTVTPQLLKLLRDDITNLNQLTPDEFERFVCDRFDKMGFEVRRVGSIYAPDGGVDVIAWPKRALFPFLLAVQAKHHRRTSTKTGPDDVKNLLATVNSGPFQAGMLITNTTFTPSAKWFAAIRPHLVRLRDANDLSRWVWDDYLDSEEWREIPSQIELAPGIVVDVKSPRRGC